MELLSYQKKVMENLSSYMNFLDKDNNIISAWKSYWNSQDVAVGFGGVPNYNNEIPGVPHVCMKVPTGGGKTFMACSSLKPIFDKMPLDKPQVVIWLVPSDSILTQTIKNLSNSDHPYRQKLNYDFAGRVGIYTKDMLLNGQDFSPDTVKEMLTICIMSYNSLRIDSKKKDVRKIYQENGNLLKFAKFFKDESVLLADTPDTALIQTLRHLSPVIVVDESHNATSDLSIEMLKNLNPSFILDLTATPKQNSNILSYVDARELKKESMVKLPVIVYNRTSRQNVIQDAIQLRCTLEKQAIEEEKAGGKYIRPIVLFQAQPKTSDDSETFDKIKSMLIDMGIKEEEIGIKTSKIDEISNFNLMSRTCKIRYIITVNALKEGWDCSFAYILASLANKTSKVDVEQILGRILRQPYAKHNKSVFLNTSYVLTSSNDFHSTLENIVSGLNKAGFSKKDFRVYHENEGTIENNAMAPEQQNVFTQDDNINEVIDEFKDIDTNHIKDALNNTSDDESSNIAEMLEKAGKESDIYQKVAQDCSNDIFVTGELGTMLNQITIRPQFQEEVKMLKIPQFFLKGMQNLFSDDVYNILEPENLSEGFSLKEQDAKVSFELSTGEIYRVDLEEQGEAVPKYKMATKNECECIRQILATLPSDNKTATCIAMLASQINKNNRYATSEVKEYVERIVSNMTNDELTAMETAIPIYAEKIRKKIESLENTHREELFYKWIDSSKVISKEFYEFPLIITPSVTTDSIPKSLYSEEKNDLNSLENIIIDNIVKLDNIKWWHRVIDRKGFRLNGFINHYPDFIVMTNSGKLILVEAKGDDRDNSNSKMKLRLGRSWQSLSGNLYKYFMVFNNQELGFDGAYTLDSFIEVIKEL